MGFEQCFVQELESIPTPSAEPEKASPCFDCSICLDFARDPVVTLCGHLYCWPCIYEWFDTSLASDELPKCPVCKSEISQKMIVPLYGRGQTLSKSEGKLIPPRPSASDVKALTDLFNPEQQHSLYQNPHSFPNSYSNSEENSSPALVNVGSSAAMASYPPAGGMFGEMVYARVFGNSQSLYTYPNSYHSVLNSTPRLRRLQLQANESLNRVSIFLFCFCVLCLIVF